MRARPWPAHRTTPAAFVNRLRPPTTKPAASARLDGRPPDTGSVEHVDASRETGLRTEPTHADHGAGSMKTCQAAHPGARRRAEQSPARARRSSATDDRTMSEAGPAREENRRWRRRSAASASARLLRPVISRHVISARGAGKACAIPPHKADEAEARHDADFESGNHISLRPSDVSVD